MEIIKRKSELSTIDTVTSFSRNRMQVSYTNSGQLALRFFDPTGENGDIVVMLSIEETNDLFKFMHLIGL